MGYRLEVKGERRKARDDEMVSGTYVVDGAGSASGNNTIERLLG